MAIDYDILIGNSTHKEIKLQKSGDIHALQKWRACETFGSYEAEKTDPNYEAPQWIEEWLWTEELLRDIAFEELSESKDLQESNLEDKKESESLEESDYLQILAKEYWLKERKLWAIKSRFENSPFTRGLKLWRSNPNWIVLEEAVVVDENAVAVRNDDIYTNLNDNRPLVIVLVFAAAASLQENFILIQKRYRLKRPNS
ncbi:hypothetical protein N7456_009212 [Penicillium angulare]|uniref:Uncharacterized protein n=1 Tax=Penicillium angulare TaxID=116970 RepID=A0A9W9F4C9_9EURO|nr:hypothetical protein N7456_009212 [Penicillium angulare]